ncbi:MAG: ABC transporter ATP-binding protein [Alphaproteobacteria bacterium]|nr:ABC transporter ATP-binding protein [Alphaproteobacteria bacterium]
MIELRGVSKSYNGRAVVGDLTLAVPRGALCVLLGPSGCGKSTTLRMINRLVPCDGGTIRIDGEDALRPPVEALRRRIGYVIQSTGLFPHWRVDDNIATVPRLLHWPEPRVRARVHELLEMLRLDPRIYAGKYPHQLSGGEQQRVGVARALAADPELLLMDEPFAAVDPVTRDALQAEIARIHEATGKTIVFVTHDIAEALRLATMIAVMDRGRVVQSGTPLDIVERPASDFVRDFVGVQGLGLKLLAVRRVRDRLQTGEQADGEPIDAGATLAEALAAMVARRVGRLAVAEGDGRVVGAIALGDLVR